MKCIVMTIFIISYFAGISHCQNKGWKGISPLNSTRADVENKLGRAINANKNSYETDSENITIYYTEARCASGGVWDVPPGTVLFIYVHPKIKSPVSDLTIDIEKYRKVEDKLPDIYYFSNDEEGATIEVDQGKVVGYYYGPAVKDQHLRCKR